MSPPHLENFSTAERFLFASAKVYTRMTIPAKMRALQQTSFAGPRHMQLITDAPVPSPGPGQLLIRVAAAGVNFADISRSYGTFRNGPEPPYLAGFEAAGEIVALGDQVAAKLGNRVVGVGYGAFAEYALLHAGAAMPVPPSWSAAQALGLVVNLPTALAALKPLGRLERGETVLIHAAAGATGQAVLKLAKHYGAIVIAAASVNKHETVRALGADHVLDSRSEALATQVRELTRGNGAELVLECAGGTSFEQSLSAARRVTGRVVVYGLAAGEATVSNWQLVYEQQVQVIGLNIGVLSQAEPRISGELMGELSALIAAGVVTPTHPTTYELAQGATALADLESRATIGKLALLP